MSQGYAKSESVAAQISAAGQETSPADTSFLGLITSGGLLRKISWANIKTAIFGAINGLTSKSTPVGADVIAIGDSAASFAGKKSALNTLAGAIMPYAKLSDVKSAGTAGGGITAGSWVTRVLNTKDIDAGGIVSLSDNQFTLQAGTYRIRASVPAYNVLRHKSRLQNITDDATVIIGSSEFTSTTASSSFIAGEFIITASTAFEIQTRVESTNGADGGGVQSNFGVSEVYTVVEIWKVA